MAIGDDFSVNAAGDIRHTSGTTNYTVLELHRWLQDLADNASTAGGSNDVLDITSPTPSERSTDQIIRLINGYNIDDTAAQFFYGGSIRQGTGATETVYYGLRILGSVAQTATQVQVVQDKAMYDGDAPFWGTQASPYNGGGNVLAQFLVKGREWGADIDQRQIRVQIRNYGDSYASFDVTLTDGVNVAAVSSVDDPQNDTAQGTVTAYTHVTNSGTVHVSPGQDETSYDNSPTTEGTFSGGTGHANSDVITLNCGCTVLVDLQSAGVVTQFTITPTNCSGATDGDTNSQVSTTGSGTGFSLSPEGDNVENDEDRPTGGFQQIDLGDGSGNQPYYSKWTYGADTSGDQLKAIWEFCKDLTRTGTAKTCTGMDGELFRGITHTYVYDNLSGTFREGEEVVWGTRIVYDTLAGGTFTPGNYVRIGSNGAAGRIMYDDGSANITVALENTSITLVDGDTITEYQMGEGNGATGVTADINVTINDNDKSGGSGRLLANDTSGLKHHVQVRTGSAPVDNLQVRGFASGATADVNATITTRTINPVFLGSYVGTMIGGFGVGFESADLTASDSVIDLDGDTNTPPNNVTWTLSGLVSGDRVLVGPKAGGNDFNFSQMTLDVALTGAAETQVDVNAIPANTPASGVIRITLDDGRVRRQPYNSITGTIFNITSADYTDPDDAAISNGVMVAYIDRAATGTSENFTTIYTSGPLALWIRVREGTTATPMKTFEVEGELNSGGGASTASRIDDF